MKKFTRQQQVLVYENNFVQLYDDDVIRPDGTPGRYIRFRYKHNPPGVVIVPRTSNGRFLLLSLYRYAFDAVSLEFPRGTAEHLEEGHLAAIRELREETGLKPTKEVELIGFIRPDTSIVETEASVFLAGIGEDSSLVPTLDDSGEAIANFSLLTRDELLDRVKRGDIRDGFTIAAIGLMAASDRL